MALIKCPACGKSVFSELISCPKCGCPADIIKRAQRLNVDSAKKIGTEEFCKSSTVTQTVSQNSKESTIEGDIIDCPWCKGGIINREKSCPRCGCPADVIKHTESIRVQKIEDKKVKACSTCGGIYFDKGSLGYMKNTCIECNGKHSYTLIELPITCKEFESKLYQRKDNSDFEYNKSIASILTAKREVFEKHVKDWSSLKKTSKTYRQNMRMIYKGKILGHESVFDFEKNELRRQAKEEKELRKQKIIEEEYQSAINSQSNGAAWDTKYFTDPCPYCGHYKVRYSKWDDKAFSTAFWGFFSPKLHANYKCEWCGKMWE